MRRIIVSLNITLDGFISGPNEELDWHFDSWTEDMARSLGEQLSSAGTILLGRHTYTAMALHWMRQSNRFDCPREDMALADMMNRYTKLVFSKTLSRLCWQNSRVLHGNLPDEITALKKQAGKGIMVLGSATLVSALVQYDLVDEYVLWVHPVILGKGKRLCRDLASERPMKLTRTETFGSGVVKLCYSVRERESDTYFDQSTKLTGHPDIAQPERGRRMVQ